MRYGLCVWSLERTETDRSLFTVIRPPWVALEARGVPRFFRWLVDGAGGESEMNPTYAFPRYDRIFQIYPPFSSANHLQVVWRLAPSSPPPRALRASSSPRLKLRISHHAARSSMRYRCRPSSRIGQHHSHKHLALVWRLSPPSSLPPDLA